MPAHLLVVSEGPGGVSADGVGAKLRVLFFSTICSYLALALRRRKRNQEKQNKV